MAERIKPEEPAAGAGVEVHNLLSGRGAANAHPVSSVTNGMANPATSNLNMNNHSITNLKDDSLGFKGGGVALKRVDYQDAIATKHTQNSDTILDSGNPNEVTAANAKDAVDKRHTQNSDTILDSGNPNEVTAANAKDAVDKKHTQGTDTALGAQAEDLDMNNHSIVNLEDASLEFQGGGSLTRTDYLDSVTKKHTQNTDYSLLDGQLIACPGLAAGTNTGTADQQEIDVNVVSDNLIHVAYINGGKPYFQKSLDGGTTWQAAVLIHDEATQDSIRIESIDANTILAIYAKNSGSVWFEKSTDGGATWGGSRTQIHNNVRDSCVDICSPDGTTIYVLYFCRSADRLKFRKSTNGGTDWDAGADVYGSDLNFTIETVRCDAIDADTVYAILSGEDGIWFYWTGNGGSGWIREVIKAGGVIVGRSDLSVVDANNLAVVYYEDNVEDSYVSVSVNAGADWTTPVALGLADAGEDVAIWAYSADIFFVVVRANIGSIMYTVDAGISWVTLATAFGGGRQNAIHGTSLENFIALSHNGTQFSAYIPDTTVAGIADKSGNKSLLSDLTDAILKKHVESHNAASHSDIASTGANIDDAVSKKHSNALDHTQGTDLGLDTGGDNPVTAIAIEDAIDTVGDNTDDIGDLETDLSNLTTGPVADNTAARYALITPQDQYRWNQTFPYLKNIGIDVSEWVQETTGEFLADAGNNGNYSVTPLINGNFFITYCKAGSTGEFQVRNLTGAAVVAETQFSAAQVTYVNTCTLRNGNVAIVYNVGNVAKFQIRDQRGAAVKAETNVGTGGNGWFLSVTPTLWGGFLVAYIIGASSRLTVYDTDGNVVTAETEFLAEGLNTTPSITTLHNGNIFFAYIYDDGCLYYQVRDSLGNAVVANTQILSDANSTSALHGATLVDGHVVIAMMEGATGNGIFYIHDQNGVQIVAKTTFDASGAITALSTVALPNGDFMIMYKDGTSLYLIVYDYTGTIVQAKTAIKSVSTSSLDLAMLPCGKVVMLYDDLMGGGGKYELWEGVWYEETYDFIPIEWAEDGAEPPDAAELISSGNGSVRIRKFAGDSTNHAVIIPWELPDKYYLAKGIKFQVLGFITETTSPEDETINFNLSGYPITTNQSLNQAFGAAQNSNVELSDSHLQYDRFVTGKSIEVDVGLTVDASVLTMLQLERDSITDTYEQYVGVYGIKIYYYKTK